jgi:hypothetical protein
VFLIRSGDAGVGRLDDELRRMIKDIEVGKMEVIDEVL